MYYTCVLTIEKILAIDIVIIINYICVKESFINYNCKIFFEAVIVVMYK